MASVLGLVQEETSRRIIIEVFPELGSQPFDGCY